MITNYGCSTSRCGRGKDPGADRGSHLGRRPFILGEAALQGARNSMPGEPGLRGLNLPRPPGARLEL